MLIIICFLQLAVRGQRSAYCTPNPYLYNMATYFSADDLFDLKAAEKKILKSVIYHNWLNKFKSGEIFQFLDKLELVFMDGTRLILSASEENEPGIIVVRDFDAERNRLLLLHQFGGKIDHLAEDLTNNPLWSLLIGKRLESIGVVDEGDNCYLSDALLLDFGDEKMEIHPGMEGLVAEPYENV
ncbi:MAG TPA: hypothetical protein VFJ43_14690 [Bacteroidia bacterium]|nr:hypothetical protein [Bacteroidia bacterium]